VGVAVAVQDGLFVPVIKRADQKGLADVSAELRSLAETARAGKLIPEQYEGGSVTISNLGMYGVDYFLPIINPPESCIIGVGAIREQPVVRAGGIAVEPVVKVSVSADHRVVDGVQAGKFFRTLKGLLEDPRRLAQ
jgi:pyruvate dehydrogenase E2 component (dihydrolipoamide acetyltransferase)